MGKKQLGELQPFEFVITLVASELACLPLSDMQIPLVYGFIPILTLLTLEVIVTKIVKHSIKLRKVINGTPTVIITPDGINTKALISLDMTIHDLLEGIRSQGYMSPSELDYAIVETNGNISCFPKSSDQKKLPYSIICEGKTMKNNMEQSSLSENNLKTILDKLSIKEKDILLFTTNEEEFYLQPLEGKYISGKIKEYV